MQFLSRTESDPWLSTIFLCAQGERNPLLSKVHLKTNSSTRIPEKCRTRPAIPSAIRQWLTLYLLLLRFTTRNYAECGVEPRQANRPDLGANVGSHTPALPCSEPPAAWRKCAVRSPAPGVKQLPLGAGFFLPEYRIGKMYGCLQTKGACRFPLGGMPNRSQKKGGKELP